MMIFINVNRQNNDFLCGIGSNTMIRNEKEA